MFEAFYYHTHKYIHCIKNAAEFIFVTASSWRMELQMNIKKISSTLIQNGELSGAVAVLIPCAPPSRTDQRGEIFMWWCYCISMLQGKHYERRSCCPMWTPWRLQVTMFWKGQSYVSFRRSKLLDVQIFVLFLSLESCMSMLELLFLCTYAEYWNGSRNTCGASNMKGLSVSILKKRQGKLAHVFGPFVVLSSLC